MVPPSEVPSFRRKQRGEGRPECRPPSFPLAERKLPSGKRLLAVQRERLVGAQAVLRRQISHFACSLLPSLGKVAAGAINKRQNRLANMRRKRGPTLGDERDRRLKRRDADCRVATISVLKILPGRSQRFFRFL